MLKLHIKIKEAGQLIMEQAPLCDHCRHVSVCYRYKYRNQEVWYCEEFCDIRFPQKGKNITASNNNFLPKSDIIETESDRLKGLCKICQNRDVCKISIRNGGIWHCDNFY